MSQRRILVIEDDKDLGATLSENLQLEGYWVDWQSDGLLGLNAAKSKIHDLILLDLMLPNLDGYEILQEIRKSSNVPVMILSAKSQVEDRLQGLELHADDYLVKPFHLKEVFLRIQNLLRRSESFQKEKLALFKIGKYTIDTEKRKIILPNGDQESLSETETKALLFFYTNRNSFLTRDEIMNHVWGFNQSTNTRTIDNMILKFRKIIEETPNQPKYFVSKRGLGYSLQTNEELYD